MSRGNKEHTKIYIITKQLGCYGQEYTETVGYTTNEYILRLFLEGLDKDELDDYVVEDFPIEQLPQQLDLYDMDASFHELYMVADTYNPNNIAISNGAVEEGILESESNYSNINKTTETFFKLLKLSELFKDKDDLQFLIEKFRMYIILIKLSDSLSNEGMYLVLQRAGFPQELIDMIELEGTDALLNRVALVKKYHNTH